VVVKNLYIILPSANFLFLPVEISHLASVKNRKVISFDHIWKSTLVFCRPTESLGDKKYYNNREWFFLDIFLCLIEVLLGTAVLFKRHI